jgi:hypothetical protein
MLKIIKVLFNLHSVQKENPIAAAIEIKEISSSNWWT